MGGGVGSNQGFGSSPLARGTRILRDDHGNAVRFIPAGAGNTGGSWYVHDVLPVHPRWRGEHVVSMAGCTRAYGSSPLARGTRLLMILQVR